MKKEIKCSNCSKVSRKEIKDINRAKANGFTLFCSKSCALESRSKTKPNQKNTIDKLGVLANNFLTGANGWAPL